MTKCPLADILWQVALPLGPCPILDLLSLMPEQLTCWVYTLLAWREGATPSSPHEPTEVFGVQEERQVGRNDKTQKNVAKPDQTLTSVQPFWGDWVGFPAEIVTARQLWHLWSAGAAFGKDIGCLCCSRLEPEGRACCFPGCGVRWDTCWHPD